MKQRALQEALNLKLQELYKVCLQEVVGLGYPFFPARV